MTPATAVITGVGLAVPGLDGAEDLLRPPSAGGGFEPATGLKGREMRHKDRASRLALRSVEPALRDAGLLADDSVYRGPAPSTAVVVSTNFGNLDSVCDFADTIAEHTVTGLSPLGLPHTSSNVIAGWVAIRYGMRGPNITVCNGGTSGTDALYWARNLIAVRRANVVVVIGVEPDTEPAARLLADGSDRPMLDGAAALVVESAEHAGARGARPRAVLTEVVRESGLSAAVDVALKAHAGPVGLWLTAQGTSVPALAGAADIGAVPTVDLAARLGHCSGALGVLQCAAGVAYLAGGGAGSVLSTSSGPDDDAATALLLTATGEAS
ncbi:beta-ketoacyl synthase N-terminal-like domain-containing protein [Streptomyces sp. NPDC002668]|uniref:beta-ketoacyl synthase N-terminal-like domain-containing protein n=1 Tax=Streptomyces sp. NPDC002668 TaxID=3154422 RepID=UPI003333C654